MAEGFDFGMDLNDPAGVDALYNGLDVVVPEPLEGVLPEVRYRRVRRDFWELDNPMDLYDDVEFRRR